MFDLDNLLIPYQNVSGIARRDSWTEDFCCRRVGICQNPLPSISVVDVAPLGLGSERHGKLRLALGCMRSFRTSSFASLLHDYRPVYATDTHKKCGSTMILVKQHLVYAAPEVTQIGRAHV